MDTTTTSIKPIEIFKAGSFIAVNGERYTFTADQVKEIAEGYQPEFSDAPLVVGHPKLESPRFGRVDSLTINDAGVLCATPGSVVPEFAAAVNAGHYPKVSASIFLPNAPGNPTPGKHYLRHVGFLGGVAPAVKGLKIAEFSTSTEGIVEFGYEGRTIVGLFRGMRDWLIETLGIDKAQQIIPDYALDTLNQLATTDDDSGLNPAPAFSDPPTKQENEVTTADQQANEQRAAALAAQEAALRERESALAAREATVRAAGHADFAEALCNSGKLLPAQKPVVIEILGQLEGANQIANFAQGDANHGKTGAALFREFLENQSTKVRYDRVTPPAAERTQAHSAEFAAPMGAIVDEDGLALLAEAKAYQAQHPDVDFISAVKIVQAR